MIKTSLKIKTLKHWLIRVLKNNIIMICLCK